MKTMRRNGHAETPLLLAFFSILAGAFWALIFCKGHGEYSLAKKVVIFAASPFVGLVFVLAWVALMLLLNWLSELLSSFFARCKRK